ncbi:MAG TPA: serine/threonine-protein kinase [Kofleriaceae bacterium]|nr:serine/threonine-protein kinase [Kofleriaceae bacterium]
MTEAARWSGGGSSWEPPPAFEEYRIVRRLGQGTMGQVYLAHDRLLDRPVAIKFVGAREVGEVARERFFAEARAVARLSHPNIVAVHRVGEVRRRPYLVSEYVRGPSLDRLSKPLPWRRVLAIGRGLACGLASAHRRGVLHCDVKPANAVLGDGDEAKLIDFGLARLLDATATVPAASAPRAALDGSALTATVTLPDHAGPVDSSEAAGSSGPESSGAAGGIAGTPLYMAPELWRGQPPTWRSDVYALGVLLYELACGRAPHTGVPVTELGWRAQSEDAAPVAQRAPCLPAALAALIDACISRDPARRPEWGEVLREMVDALAEVPRPRAHRPD